MEYDGYKEPLKWIRENGPKYIINGQMRWNSLIVAYFDHLGKEKLTNQEAFDYNYAITIWADEIGQ